MKEINAQEAAAEADVPIPVVDAESVNAVKMEEEELRGKEEINALAKPEDTTPAADSIKSEPTETPVGGNSEETKPAEGNSEANGPSSEDCASHTRSKSKPGELSASALKQKLANVIVYPRLKPSAFPSDTVSTPAVSGHFSVKGLNFNLHDDLPLNRRGYKYKPCVGNQHFKANMYSTTELAPFGVRASYFDRSQGVACSDDMAAISTQQGWLSARCNVAMREGRTYFEYDIINANNSDDKAHVRVGIARRESSLEAPVGFDGYGYGLRDVTGQKITLSRPQEFMASGFASGDTLGILVELPSLEQHRESNRQFAVESRVAAKKRRKQDSTLFEEEARFNRSRNIVRDQVPIKYRNGLYFEQFEYTRTKAMDHLLNPITVFGEKAVLEKHDAQQIPTMPGSRMVVYKNGQRIGESFTDLYSFLPVNAVDADSSVEPNTQQSQNPGYRNTDDGTLGYYPMMSAFSSGVVRINAGPNFKYAVPENAVPLCERYDDAVVEEYYWDLLEEVEASYLDSFE